MKKLIVITFPCLLAAHTMFVIQDTNVRSKPSLDSKIINIYKKNTPVEVLKKVYSQNGTWYQTTDGYVSNELLASKGFPKTETRSDIDEHYFSDGIYMDASKIINKELYIDKPSDTVYTLIPMELRKQVLPPKPDIIYGNFSYAKIFESENSIESLDLAQKKEKKQKDIYEKWFVSALLGYSSLDAKYSNINGSFSPVEEADGAGYNFGFDVGYNLSKNLFTTFEYNQINLDDAEFYNYLFSANYRFNISYVKSFIGVIGGISYFKVSDSHINNLEAIDLKGRNTIYGIQTGIELPIIKNYQFLIKYQYLKTKHTTNLIDGTTKAQWERDNYHNVQMGIRYEF